MALNLINLDAVTRKYMLEEIESAEKAGRLYISSRLSIRGVAEYLPLLKASAAAGDDVLLANELRTQGRLNPTEPRNIKSGTIWAKVPVTAPETLAEGEFNQFYSRGVCRRAIDEGKKVRVYRAKAVANPHSDSDALIGRIFDPNSLLQVLREHIGSEGTDAAFGLPRGPNSGLSICLS